MVLAVWSLLWKKEWKTELINYTSCSSSSCPSLFCLSLCHIFAERKIFTEHLLRTYHIFSTLLNFVEAFFSLSLSLLLSSLLLFVWSTLYPTLSSSMAAWDLSVIVEDFGNEAPPVTLSVSSDLHIGGVMLKLVEKTRRLLYVSICLSQLLSHSLHRQNMLYLANFHWQEKKKTILFR